MLLMTARRRPLGLFNSHEQAGVILTLLFLAGFLFVDILFFRNDSEGAKKIQMPYSAPQSTSPVPNNPTFAPPQPAKFPAPPTDAPQQSAPTHPEATALA